MRANNRISLNKCTLDSSLEELKIYSCLPICIQKNNKKTGRTYQEQAALTRKAC